MLRQQQKALHVISGSHYRYHTANYFFLLHLATPAREENNARSRRHHAVNAMPPLFWRGTQNHDASVYDIHDA